MKNWTIIGFIATIAIVFSIPLYLLKTKYIISRPDGILPAPAAAFTGNRKCRECHKKEYDAWYNSHHDHAMEMATETSVLGDFNNAEFHIHGVTSRFYKKEGKFLVYTQGPGGRMQEFEVTHTFGWYPLQQYLVPFPGGRLQCLPIAWDVQQKKWYHLYPDAPIAPQDWLYWTNAGQNWNGMCAECHSTNLKKNFDIQNNSYQTTWSEIDVGCEACHGPGSRHVTWAELPDMARPQVENYDLLVKTSRLDSRELVELCAPCHSRRAILGDYTHAEPDLLDSMLPSLLTADLYFPDGQILDEVYVYGSFTQSKMYHREVRCSDCHDVHSLKPLKEGNALCLQCHRAEEYDTKQHHFHKKKGEEGKPVTSADGKVLFNVGTGAECVQCHMPGRVYMGIDYRPDHSFRIARPDLSIKIGTPNACNRCHLDKTPQWSDEYITKWYGSGRRLHYGAVIETGRKAIPDAGKDLTGLAANPLYPVIVRATALSLLRPYPGHETSWVYTLALMDDEALIRRTAVENLHTPDINLLVKQITPLLYDPVKAVRIEAAVKLAGEPSKHLDADQKKIFQKVLKEYIGAMEYSGDFAFGRYNLGNLYFTLNRTNDAIENYRSAIQIDNLFYRAKVNLAMLYNGLGNQDEAEVLLREVVTDHPELHEIAYSLGLLLAEKKNYDEAVLYLGRAAEGMPEHPRVQYNLGVLLDYLQRDRKAEAVLLKAIELDSDHIDYLRAAAEFYLKRKRFAEARRIAEQMVRKHPYDESGRKMMDFIDRNLE
jgi:tetratricopeptide (TPR) repeat protein